MPELTKLARITDIPAPSEGWITMASAVTVDGSLAVLHINFDLWARHERHRPVTGGWRDYSIPAKALGRISVLKDGAWEPGEPFKLQHYPFILFDRLGPDSWVIAKYRGWNDDPPANRISAGRAEPMDLGIQLVQLQTERDGSIWTGYLDSGIFSDHPMSQEGIAKFSKAGELLWGCNTDGRALIDSAEALNVCDQGVWGSGYMDYQIVRLDLPKSRNLRSRMGPSDVLATNGQLFLSGDLYPGASREDMILELKLLDQPPARYSRRLRRLWKGDLLLPSHQMRDLLVARGDCIHYVTDTHWHRITIDDFVAELKRTGQGKSPYEPKAKPQQSMIRKSE